MTNQEYIHITEAVKKRDKTRQTFYNYIHKGLVRTKKINNKVYLHYTDIEQLMNGFIPDAIEPIEIIETSDAQETKKEPSATQLISETTLPRSSQGSTVWTTRNVVLDDTEMQKKIDLIQQDMTRLHKQYYTLKDDLINEVKWTKQDILFDTSRLSKHLDQYMMQWFEWKQQHTSKERNRLTKDLQKIKYAQKKISFWIGYCSFVLVNIVIITYMI